MRLPLQGWSAQLSEKAITEWLAMCAEPEWRQRTVLSLSGGCVFSPHALGNRIR